MEGKTILAETWLMEVEMQFHTFMLGIDVARRAPLSISTPPFQIGGAGKETCAKDNNLYPVWGDDTIWNMLCKSSSKVFRDE